MRKIVYPPDSSWDEILSRPVASNDSLHALVQEIFNQVQMSGDEAVRKYAKQFDGFTDQSLLVTEEEADRACRMIKPTLSNAMELAAGNIRRFHEMQDQPEPRVETKPGVSCWRESRPIDKVGLYIPGGSAPLFSTVLMLAIPAQVAGCREIILTTPAGRDGKIAGEILFAARLSGIQKIFKIGGIQAIAAMTFGTGTVPHVDKILGPGNQYVTAAKQYAQYLGTAIDMPAGPSEVLVIADDSARPAWVAADLLSQAEHGPDSQVVLVTWNEELANQVIQETNTQLNRLPRKEIASRALEHARIIVCRNRAEAVRITNRYAPEHLIMSVTKPNGMLEKIRHAGSVFLGNFTPESAGDYASGTNHTLPTNGFARVYGGVSLDTYRKKMTVQQISKQGLENIGDAIEIMAEAENLIGHKEAVRIRRTEG